VHQVGHWLGLAIRTLQYIRAKDADLVGVTAGGSYEVTSFVVVLGERRDFKTVGETRSDVVLEQQQQWGSRISGIGVIILP